MLALKPTIICLGTADVITLVQVQIFSSGESEAHLYFSWTACQTRFAFCFHKPFSCDAKYMEYKAESAKA